MKHDDRWSPASPSSESSTRPEPPTKLQSRGERSPACPGAKPVPTTSYTHPLQCSGLRKPAAIDFDASCSPSASPTRTSSMWLQKLRKRVDSDPHQRPTHTRGRQVFGYANEHRTRRKEHDGC